VKLVFWPTAWDDYLHWQQTDPRGLAKLNDLISECRRTPFKGTGKPEPLGGNLSGW
jgi:toxin YoeB